MMRPKSVPAGSVPKAGPRRRPGARRRTRRRRPAAAWRTSSEPCSASAIRSTMRRARGSIVSMSASSSRSSSTKASRRGSAPARQVDLGEEGLERVRRARPARAGRRAHMTLPEPSQIEASGPRGRGAACPTPRRSRRRRGTRAPRTRAGRALADQYLATGVPRPLELCASLGRRRRLVVGARQPHRQHRRRLGLDREVGEHVAHQRLVDQRLAEGGAVGGVVESPGRRRRASRRRAPITQSRRVWPTISMIVGTPRPGSPTIRAQAPSELDLAGGVGAVAELVLEPLDVEARCASPSGRISAAAAKHERPSSVWARTRNSVAHRRRAEPLVAGRSRTRRPGPPPFSGVARSSCWRARRSRPASRSSPSRTARRAFLGGRRASSGS